MTFMFVDMVLVLTHMFFWVFLCFLLKFFKSLHDT